VAFSRTVTALNGVCSREKFGRNPYPTTHRGRGGEGELSHNAPVRFGNSGRIELEIAPPLPRPSRPGIISRDPSSIKNQSSSPYEFQTRATRESNIIGRARVQRLAA